MKHLFLLVIFYTSVFGQAHNPTELLKSIQAKFNAIEDYSVDIEIDIDANFVDAPKSKAKIYFKKPNKVKIESDGFAILPKQGLTFSPSEFLSESYSAILIKSEVVDSFMVDKIKVVPLVDSSNIIISTVWADPLYKVIRKVESITKNMGTITVYLSYFHLVGTVLPSQAKFFFNVAKVGHATMFKNPDAKTSNKEKKNLSGTVLIKYSNYQINKNLPNSFFYDEE